VRRTAAQLDAAAAGRSLGIRLRVGVAFGYVCSTGPDGIASRLGHKYIMFKLNDRGVPVPTGTLSNPINAHIDDPLIHRIDQKLINRPINT